MPVTDTENDIPYSQFICIGTGFSGIGLGATLKRWYGITDVKFFEREADVGGTWFLNTYPGAAADVPNVLYCLSYEADITWTKILPEQDEVLAYLKGVANKYDIPSRTAFRTPVTRCQWFEDRQRWRVHVKNLDTNILSVHESQFVFTATGLLDQPQDMNLKGLENFKGPVFHTARWRHDIDLSGKDVVVMGNGCTGTQLIPALAPLVKSVTQFVRSKHWIVPSLTEDAIKPVKFLYKYIPGATKALRFLIFWAAEDDFNGAHMTEKGAAWRTKKMTKLKDYIRETAPERYHDLLIPDFEFGCKRRVFNAGYMESLHRDDVELTMERPLEALEDHIVTSGGKTVKADAIIFANGFKTERVLHGIECIGREGTLEEHWDSLGGPGAYNTTAMNGFPNFFMIIGPNSATSHSSAILASENAINLALRQIKPVLDGRATSVEVTRAAEQEHVVQLQKELSTKVWASGCGGWYTTTDEKGEPAWNATLWPYTQANLWWRCLFPTKSHWKYNGSKSSGDWSMALLISGVLLAVVIPLLTSRGREMASLYPLHGWRRNWTSFSVMS